MQELALRWSISRAPRRSEQQTLGAFHLAAHFIGTGQLNEAKDAAKTLRKVAPRSDAATELSAMVTAALGEKPEVEMRIDASDGNPYPFTSFQEVYGPQVRNLCLLSFNCTFSGNGAGLKHPCCTPVQAEEYWAIAEPAPQ